MLKLVIVDVNNFIFRAYYAIPRLTDPKGRPVNAVMGVLKMFLKLLSTHHPTHFVLAKDSQTSIRKKLDSSYKANRQETPEDLISQFDIIYELFSKLNMIYQEIDGFEADDVIATIVSKFKTDFDHIYVASSDKDLMQLVDDKVTIVDTMKDQEFDSAKVFQKFGVYPNQIEDYLTLVGDTSDNISGVKGIGAKTASSLLSEFGTIEKIIASKDLIKGKRITDGLSDTSAIEKSRQLVRLNRELELTISLDDLKYKFEASDKLISFLSELGFKSVLNQLAEISQGELIAKITDQATNSKFEYKLIDLNNDQLKSLKKIAVYLDDESGYLYIAPNKYEVARFVFNEDTIKLIADTQIIGFDLKKILRYQIPILAKLIDLGQINYLCNSDVRDPIAILQQYDIFTMKEGIAAAFWVLQESLLKKLDQLGLVKVYELIDRPLISVLASMESIGIGVNPYFLTQLRGKLEEELILIEKLVQDETGGDDINLRSPKQLSFLLFEKLRFPVIKAGKTGPSTDSEVLEKLAELGMPSNIPKLLLKYRETDKILTTYVIGLLDQVKNGRIHTHFNSFLTATGRLSSDNPNLQNIPIRSPGKLVRKAFVAGEDSLFLSFDYSQVELRVLAHLSKDSFLVTAFKNNQDIHHLTATEIFGKDDISEEERGMAKTVNFGLIYGQSSFGLAKMLGISQALAKEYITKYFAKFTSVKGYLDSLIEFCKVHGYVETIYGHRRYIEDIHSKNRMARSAAERMAINTPIQGSAADIIKIAMINIFKRFTEESLKSKMILQVHDELLFEVPESEIDTAKNIITKEMESFDLEIPLTVNVKMGINWHDMK